MSKHYILTRLTKFKAVTLSHSPYIIMVQRSVHGIDDKPRPQEQYFQESPFLIGQGIPGKTGPQERGEEKQEVSELFLF